MSLKEIWEKFNYYFWHPPKFIQFIIYSLAVSFIILLLAVSFNRPVKLVFNFSMQLIEVTVGNSQTEIPANITIEHGKMYVNGVPIRDWLEKQGYQVIWDDTQKSAIAIK